MAIFLRDLKLKFSDKAMASLNVIDAYYHLTPIPLLPNTMLPSVTKYPYNLYLDTYTDTDSHSEYVGLIYLTRHELKLVEEHGIPYLTKLLAESDADVD